MATRDEFGAVDLAGRRRRQDVDGQGAFAGARDAADRREVADREARRDVLQVVLRGALDDEVGFADGFLFDESGQRGSSRKVCAGAGGRVLAAGGGRAGEDDLAALDARAWTHLDEMVGREHHVAVVLNDDEGIPEVTEALE